MERDRKIYVAGHNGMVGSAVVRQLRKKGVDNIILRSRQELDLTDTAAVKDFFESEKPDIVVMAAARVGGILANMQHPAEFIYENLIIQNNVIHHAYLNDVRKFCFLGSSCVYPRQCPQPMKEQYLMTGPLEPTNEAYAIAKIAGIKMVQFYRRQYGFDGFSLMPCNLYGTNDNFDPQNAHVLSSLVKKFVDAADSNHSTVTVWGSGKARREFMHVDDAAEAILFFIERYDSDQILNIGWGEDISVKNLAELTAEKAGFQGKIEWDLSKPDGMPLKCMDVSRMKEYGFTPGISLEEGIEKIIAEYRQFMAKPLPPK